MALTNKANVMSIVRSALKIVGALAIASGFADADQTGAITSNIEVLVGTIMTLVGLFMSLWEHTPDEATAPPKSIVPPADVAAVMALNPEKTS